MPVGKTCGNCRYFIRIKKYGGNGRNGICDELDYNCHSDSSYAKECEYYKGKKYKRRNLGVREDEAS